MGIIDSSGNLVVQYRQTAYDKVTVAKDTSNLATINPFRYKGYYFDQESGMYYCHTRYFVPDWCRWLNNDSICKLEILTSYCMNLSCYCDNNPISRSDISGGSWKSFCERVGNFLKKVGKWFQDNVGFSINVGKEQGLAQYNWLYTTETGVGYSKSFDNGKPINFYVNLPNNWWKFWEISIGLDINYKGYGIGIGLGTETSVSFHTGNNSLDLYVNGLGRFGAKWVSNGPNGTYGYSKLELNGPEIAVTVGVAVGIGYLIAAGGSAIATAIASLLVALGSGLPIPD